MHSLRILFCTLQFICPAGSKYPQIQISNLRNVCILHLYRSLKRNVNTCKQFCIYFANLKNVNEFIYHTLTCSTCTIKKDNEYLDL